MTSIDLSPTASDVATAVRDRAWAWTTKNQDDDEDEHRVEIIDEMVIETCGEPQILARVLDTKEGIACMPIAQGILESANQDLRLSSGRVQITSPSEYRLTWN